MSQIAEESVKSLILEYFKRELGDTSLHMQSGVFPQPVNDRVVLYNQLAVRTCLVKNWQGIQEAYPCLHGIGQVVGDADFLYMMLYPYCDLRTYSFHVVETVHDFVHFILTFIKSLCMSDTCFQADCVNRKRMVDHTSPTDSTQLTQFKAVGQPEAPGLSARQWGGKLENPVKVDHHRYGWGPDTPMVEQGRNFNKGVVRRSHLRFGVLEYKPELPLVCEGIEELKALKSVGDAPTKLWGKTFLVSALNVDPSNLLFLIDENEATGDFELISVQIKGVRYTPSPDEMASFNQDCKMVVDAIVNDEDLAFVVSFLRQNQLLKHPFDWYVQGAIDSDDKWHVNFAIYVIDEEKIVIQEIQAVKDLHMQRLDTRSDRLTLIFDDGLDFDKSFTGNIPHFVGEKPTPQSDAEITGRLTEKKVHLGTHAKAVEDSSVLTEAFVGSRLEALENLDQRRAVLLFMGKKKVNNNPEILTHMMRTFTDHADTISELRSVPGEHTVQYYFDIADAHARISGGDTCGVAVRGLTDVLTVQTREAFNLQALDDECRTKFAGYIASFAPQKMDEQLAKDVAGWEDFVNDRDATKNAIDRGDQPTNDDIRRTAWANRC
ncbi:unnamed protein product [Pylaiella littoralis]